jgi:outer membrane protein TolC
MLQQIEYPDLIDDSGMSGDEFLSPPATTLEDVQDLMPWDLTLDECVAMTLANSKVMQKIGGAVITAPAAVTTLYDQALQETNPFFSVEAALSAFDAQMGLGINGGSSTSAGRSFFDISAPGDPPSFFEAIIPRKNDSLNTAFNITKVAANGTTFTVRNDINYAYSQSGAGFIPSSFGGGYDMRNRFQIRQPLGRGAGTTVNRIAGPNATPGNYNGVLIARINSDISLADFEVSVRNLVRDVENNYWELYFAYRDLDTKLAARDAARETWENRKLRYENGVGRPDDEAQARQQYLNFQFLAQNVLVGTQQGLGVLGSERNLRRLMGLPVNDGRLIRPITEPTVAPVVFDWQDSQAQTLARRVEIRRQKWTIRQRELQLIAAKELNKWQFDFVADYGNGGFGKNLFGPDSAVSKSPGVDDWQVGFEYGGAIGNRQGHLAIRNAELALRREKTVLREQQRQLLLDLGAAFAEVDRSLAAMRTSFNSRVAVQEELEPKEKRVLEGQDQVFFLLDAQQRAATAESALHRSVADYNLSLLNYALTTGTLLSRYNIQLVEGPWTEEAQCGSLRNASRLKTDGPNVCNTDSCPVTLGPYNQRANVPVDVGNASNTDVYYDPNKLPAPNNAPIDNGDTGPSATRGNKRSDQ